MAGGTSRNEATLLLRIVHVLSEMAGTYRLQQQIAYFTTSRFRLLIKRHMDLAGNGRVLDLGCGPGNYRDVLGTYYTGIDTNVAYIDAARRRLTGHFEVMDCSRLAFQDASFDHVVTIAATHHLDNAQLHSTLREAARVCRPDGAIHVIDAVLPETGNRIFKRVWFGLDAGRFPRTRATLRAALALHGTVVQEDFLSGPLHDCVYLRATRL